jgi:hypothetical protein
MPEADASGPVAPPGGPLPDDFRDAIHGLRQQAREEDRQAEDARKRAAKRPFSRFVKIGVALILAQSALLAVLYKNQEKTAATRQEIKSILPANSCNAMVNRTYWKVVAFLRDQGHPPARLEDLVPKYLEIVPLDPVTGKALSYSTDGRRFQVDCPDVQARR